MSRTWALVVAIGCVACSEELAEPGSVVLTSGQEPDVWGVEPAPTSAVVEKEDEDGDKIELGSYDVPLERFSLGRGNTGRFVVTGYDDTGAVRARARSLPASPAGLSSSKLPLFISRTGEFARPPGALNTQQFGQLAGILANRYLVLPNGQDGDAVAVDGYDFGGWRPVAPGNAVSCPNPPCNFEAFAIVGTRALAITEQSAIWFDLDTGESGDVELPEGLASWSDVAWAKTLYADDGTAFIVGATRISLETTAVLRINPDQTIDALQLVAPRVHASAVWLSGRGLLVVGGSEEPTVAGAELLAAGADAFIALPYAGDETRGAALAPWDASTVLRVGGQDTSGTPSPTVTLSLACGSGCSPEPLGPTVELADATAFRVEVDPQKPAVLIVGEDEKTGLTGAIRFDGQGLEPIPLREPRRGAIAIAAPTGHVAIVAGNSALAAEFVPTLELYIE